MIGFFYLFNFSKRRIKNRINTSVTSSANLTDDDMILNTNTTQVKSMQSGGKKEQ